jgi:predicted ATPase
MLGMLKRIKIEGFKSIKNLDLELRPLNILIGPNGAGKSNLIAFFRLMNNLVEKNLQVFVRKQGGADKILHFGEKVTRRLVVDLDFPPNEYRCVLEPTVTGGLVFKEEYCRVVSWHHGEDIGDKSGHKRVPLAKPGDEESGLASISDQESPSASSKDRTGTIEQMRQWTVYHFADTGPDASIKKACNVHDNLVLRRDASNLAAYLSYIHKTQAKVYEEIVATIRRVAPFFQDFILEPDPINPEMIRLRWKHEGTDAYFDANDLSDGTLRFICLATLLLQPEPPQTILMDEPELGLHPYAIQILAGLMRSASARTQIIASTQSVTLANEFGPDDIVIADRKENESVFRRLAEPEVKDWLASYGVGDLWQKNLVGGTP